LHNDANVLALGGGLLGDRLLREIVTVWLTTEFEGGRHQGRLDKIARLEHTED
jgi:ribose 5-phosphate isomerase B